MRLCNSRDGRSGGGPIRTPIYICIWTTCVCVCGHVDIGHVPISMSVAERERERLDESVFQKEESDRDMDSMVSRCFPPAHTAEFTLRSKQRSFLTLTQTNTMARLGLSERTLTVVILIVHRSLGTTRNHLLGNQQRSPVLLLHLLTERRNLSQADGLKGRDNPN